MPGIAHGDHLSRGFATYKIADRDLLVAKRKQKQRSDSIPHRSYVVFWLNTQCRARFGSTEK